MFLLIAVLAGPHDSASSSASLPCSLVPCVLDADPHSAPWGAASFCSRRRPVVNGLIARCPVPPTARLLASLRDRKRQSHCLRMPASLLEETAKWPCSVSAQIPTPSRVGERTCQPTPMPTAPLSSGILSHWMASRGEQTERQSMASSERNFRCLT